MKKKRKKKRKLLLQNFLLFSFLLLLVSVLLNVVKYMNNSNKVEEYTDSDIETTEAQIDLDGEAVLTNTSTVDWNLILVNKTHYLPTSYTVQTKKLANGKEIDKRIYAALIKMLKDGEAEGLDFVVISGYRTNSYQQKLLDEEIEKNEKLGYSYDESYEIAITSVAIPGTSEHELGLAVDIVSAGYSTLNDKQADTPEAKWLKENSYKYGFIERYPDGKTDITGIIFEPWHYRYVGVDAATEITNSGLCLEEYLQQKGILSE